MVRLNVGGSKASKPTTPRKATPGTVKPLLTPKRISKALGKGTVTPTRKDVRKT